MKKDDFGVFEITIPAIKGKPAIPHNSKLKVRRSQWCANSIVKL